MSKEITKCLSYKVRWMFIIPLIWFLKDHTFQINHANNTEQPKQSPMATMRGYCKVIEKKRKKQKSSE